MTNAGGPAPVVIVTRTDGVTMTTPEDIWAKMRGDV
jgi:hypothetical protein